MILSSCLILLLVAIGAFSFCPIFVNWEDMCREVIRVFFDTETYVNYKGLSVPYLIGWFTDLNDKVFNYSVEPHDSFFNFLSELSVKYDVQLWAHNVQYDLEHIYILYLVKLPHRSNKIWQVTDTDKFIRFKYIGKGNNLIKFTAYCTARWTRAGLAELAIKLNVGGLKKGKIDYKKRGYCRVLLDKNCIEYSDSMKQDRTCSLVDELEYLRNDLCILYTVWQYISREKQSIMQLFDLHKEKIDPKTIPSFAAWVLNKLMGGSDKKNYYKEVYKTKISDTLSSMMELTKTGGFTAFNKSITKLVYDHACIYSYDVNSMYPSIMYQGLPYGPILDEYVEGAMTWYVCTMTNVRWKDEYCFFSREPVPVKYYKGQILMCGMYLKILNEMTHNDIQVVGKKYQLHGARDEMTILINALYSVKSDPNSDQVRKEASKKNMNTLFGKFLQKDYSVDYFYSIKDGSFIEYEPETPRSKTSCLTGCYITQVAQSILLHNIVVEHNKGNLFVYCDTDSIKIIQNVEPSFIVGDELGDWKFEGKYNVYMNNGKSKKYLLWNYNYELEQQQIKMSGVHDSVKAIILQKFTYLDYIKLYDVKNNVRIVNGTRARFKNDLGQTLISDTHIEFNKGIPITHDLNIWENNYWSNHVV